MLQHIIIQWADLCMRRVIVLYSNDIFVAKYRPKVIVLFGWKLQKKVERERLRKRNKLCKLCVCMFVWLKKWAKSISKTHGTTKWIHCTGGKKCHFSLLHYNSGTWAYIALCRYTYRNITTKLSHTLALSTPSSSQFAYNFSLMSSLDISILSLRFT